MVWITSKDRAAGASRNLDTINRLAYNSTKNMKYNVAQLLKQHTGSSRRYALQEDISGIDPELQMREPLVGEIELIRTADGILVKGRFSTAVELECSRCLEPFVEGVELEVEEEFRPTLDINTGKHLSSLEEATTIDAHHILDLTEVVRQVIFLALPMHPLCRPDCAGLCSQCGKNLNEGPCGCVKPTVDPRLEALSKLL